MEAKPEISEENKIMMMLVRIGDENVDRIDSHIQKLCGHLCSKIEVLKQFITETFLTCVQEIPNKPFIYAYIIYSMAAEESENVADIVKEVFSVFSNKIEKGEDATAIVKFLGALADTGYLEISVFETMIRQLLDLHSKAVAQNKENDYFLNLALTGYCFGRRRVVANTAAGAKHEIEQILEQNVKSRTKTAEDYNVFRALEFETPISLLWDSIALSYQDNTTFDSKLYSIYLLPSGTYIEDLGSKSIPSLTSLPALEPNNLPFQKSPGCFELFASRCIAQTDKATYALSRDLIHSTLLAFQQNPYFACQRLASMPNIENLAYLIFDVLFDEIFRLPEPSQRPIYYASICATLVKEFSEEGRFEFGPVVGEGLQAIFSTGDTTAPEEAPTSPR